ncbi:hypothetical protein A2851_00095 [Candidatus Kaiserbacteria bacterium RIFCSPHIGHO2_01_FULL_53_29]|uniref:Peptidase S49 domain-containing protein n=1 Tax=Candidatus Kaiserbacteria bacterium RIFCSPHIGHO2_01_FULL_53_29 TaxID=1798480 RepID=A0A1F6CW47_9BACT|nr:MAG: hypothetical protein A2851_00095 [Candidatus Kaiserbacteria bacterium RIFCSPHIGHO2_01_FULL_53_29]
MTGLWRSSLVVAAAAFLGAASACALMLWWAGLLPLRGFSAMSPAYCNVLKIPVYGEVITVRPTPQASAPLIGEEDFPSQDSTYAVSLEIEEAMRSASTDPNIKALLVDIDSGGGGPVAGLEIASAIRRFGRPSVAVIHEIGASSAYLAAAAADTIFASEESAVGSIGVSGSFLDQSEKNEREGITFHQLSSGPYKDTYSPDKPLTEAERALIMRDIKTSHENFVRAVAAFRKLPIEKVAAFADGSTLMGTDALEAGLIDQLGGTDDALSYLEEVIGEPVAVCLW